MGDSSKPNVNETLQAFGAMQKRIAAEEASEAPSCTMQRRDAKGEWHAVPRTGAIEKSTRLPAAKPATPPVHQERYEQLFSAIAEGDGTTITRILREDCERGLGDSFKNRIKRLSEENAVDGVPNPAMTRSDLQFLKKAYARQVVPSPTSAYGFPESLLQRAVRAQKPESVTAIMNIARKDSDVMEQLLNSQRAVDGNTVLHDLAASIPENFIWPKDSKAWNPAKLLETLVAYGADVTIKNTPVRGEPGKTAAEIAPNPMVRAALLTYEAQMAQELAEGEAAYKRPHLQLVPRPAQPFTAQIAGLSAKGAGR